MRTLHQSFVYQGCGRLLDGSRVAIHHEVEGVEEGEVALRRKVQLSAVQGNILEGFVEMGFAFLEW